MTDTEITAQVAKNTSDIGHIFHEIDDIKDEVKDIHRLTSSVERIAEKMDSTAQKVDKIDSRLEDIEKEPRDKLEHYKRLIIGCIITGVLGTVIGALLTLIIR